MTDHSKVALITNCMEYGGPASVKALAAEGFTLHCHDPKFADSAVREQFAGRYPDAIMTDTADPEELVSEAFDRHQRIDCLVSNDCGYSAQMDFDAADFRHALEVLTVTPYRLCAAVIPHMQRQGGGSIVLITSGGPLLNPVASRDGKVSVHYQVGREAAHGLVRCLAASLGGDNIQVNAIAPFMLYSKTYFPSEQGADDPAYAPLLQQRVPMGRFGTDDEFAELVALCASGRSRFVSGQIIGFSGGGA